ncbi:hypothetical protein L7F22_039861 [Adiantum nelumboides]|nr:hypothetical protein [Adiantum nelumboides]
MPKEIYEVATDPELRETNSRLGLWRYYEQEPCGVDFQRAYELMASIKEDGHAMITNTQGENIEVVITKEIVAEALKLPMEGINMRARDRKVEGVLKKDTAATTFNDITMRQVQDPTRLYQQHFHFAAKKPARYTTPNDAVASTFTQVLRSTSRFNIDHAQYVHNALKATKKEGKGTYLGAPEVLTRIAYHAIEESSDDDEEGQSAETSPHPADIQESSDNAEKRAQRREMMKIAVAAHQKEPTEKKAHHVREKEAYKKSHQAVGATSALWSPTSVQPRTKNPKKRLQVESAQLIQQMWEEAEVARQKEVEEEMARKVKAAQEAALGSSSSTRSPPVSPPVDPSSPPSPKSPPPPQKEPEQETTSAPQELPVEQEKLPFINQPEKPTPLFPKITIIELPREKRKIKAPKLKKTLEEVKQNIFSAQPSISFILEQLDEPMPSPRSSSSNKSYDIFELESGDLELHEVQKISQAPSPIMEAEKVEEVAKMAPQVEESTAMDMDVQETIQQTQESLQDLQQERDIDAEKSPPRDILKRKEAAGRGNIIKARARRPLWSGLIELIVLRRDVGAAALVILLMSSTITRMPESEAKEVVVGNEMGWTTYDKESFKVPNYATWAASQKVVVGDQIGKWLLMAFELFKYVKGMHNIHLLPSKAAYASCDFSKAKLLDAGSSGLFMWNAERPGEFYFGCNKSVEEEGNNCGSGQKLALFVSSTAKLMSSSPQSSPQQDHQLVAPTPTVADEQLHFHHEMNLAAHDRLSSKSHLAIMSFTFFILLVLHNIYVDL